MVIDDERVIREHVSGFFIERGWNVLKASHGKAALRILRKCEWSCSCIILDQLMPQMDGLTFLKMLRDKEPRSGRIPVIVLSAYANGNPATKKQFQGYGSAHVFQKPQDPELLEYVARAIMV